MTWLLTIIAGLFGVLGGLGGPADPPEPDGVGTLAGSWSQGQDERVEPGSVTDGVVWDDAARDDLLASLPRGEAADAVRRVDLATDFLVVGGYHRCTESSYVVLSADGAELRVTDGDPGVSCAWSPYTVDVWAVPRSALEE